LKNRSLSALVASGLLLAAATLALTACGRVVLYKTPEYNYAGRPIPPSKLLQRVMAAYSANGSSGGLEILDGLRDLRSNVQNTTKFFTISGYAEAMPETILNFPEQLTGYVFSLNDGALTAINYSKESGAGPVANFAANSPSAAAAPQGNAFAGAAEQAGLLIITVNGANLDLNLPGVYKTVVDRGGEVILAMVRNSDTLYRVVHLPSTPNPVRPPGYVDCEPLLLPAYCVVPVAGTYNRPNNAAFSLDGTTAYVLNGGPELGGTQSSVTFLEMSQLNMDLVPTVNPLSVGAPSPMSSLPVANPIPVPGGATAALPEGTTLYLSGQQLQTSGTYAGLFAGNLSLLNLSTYTVGAPISISDGNHTRMLFADDNTLWIGSSQCANGVRAAVATQELATSGVTDQAGNYNCLTLASLNAGSPGAQPSVQILPAVTQVPAGANGGTAVPYPNTNQNAYYYGSLTGICWVQNYHKVFSAYGGQIHAFYTGGKITDTNDPAINTTPVAGSELNNYNFTVQGTVLDVAYMDAETNSAN
jgi:hypothetical protein